MAETLQGIYSVPPCIVHTFDRVLRIICRIVPPLVSLRLVRHAYARHHS